MSKPIMPNQPNPVNPIIGSTKTLLALFLYRPRPYVRANAVYGFMIYCLGNGIVGSVLCHDIRLESDDSEEGREGESGIILVVYGELSDEVSYSYDRARL